MRVCETRFYTTYVRYKFLAHFIKPFINVRIMAYALWQWNCVFQETHMYVLNLLHHIFLDTSRFTASERAICFYTSYKSKYQEAFTAD